MTESTPKQTTTTPDPSKLTSDQLFREIDHIRELYDQRFVALDLRQQQRFEAQSKAIDAALTSADARFADLASSLADARLALSAYLPRQEYAAQFKILSDRIEAIANSHGVYLIRAEYETQHKILTDKLDAVRLRLSETTGKESGSNVDNKLEIIGKQILQLQNDVTLSQGSTRGADKLWGYIIGAIGLTLAITVFIINLTVK
jgi:hypothetical protein